MTSDYTLLMFDWDDSVAMIQVLRAGSEFEALKSADALNRSQPHLAGYQLWHDGERIVATYPQSEYQPVFGRRRIA